MAQDDKESRPRSRKKRRVSLPWPAALRQNEAVKVTYEIGKADRETLHTDRVSSGGDSSTLSKTNVTPAAPTAEDDPSGLDLKLYWIPDSACKECSECGIRFNFVIRRHHCRVCGRIYCSTCCGYTVPSRHIAPGLRKTMKACLRCVEVSRVHRVSQQRNMARDQQHVSSNPFLEIRREAFGETVADVGVAPFDSEYRPGFEAAPIGVTAAEGDEKLLSLYEDEVQFNLQNIWSDLCQEVVPRTHRLRLRSYPRSFSAQAIVDWLAKRHTKTRDEALQIGQALVDSRHLRFINSTTATFRDDPNLLLEAIEVPTFEVEYTKPSDVGQDDPVWLHNTRDANDVGGDHLFHSNTGDSDRAHGANFFESMSDTFVSSQASTLGQSSTDSLTFNEPTDSTTMQHIYETIPNFDLPTYDGTSREKALPSIQQLHDNHFDALLVQQVQSMGLSLSWIGVIKPLVIETSREVRTNLLPGDVMDIKNYVKVKKIPGGVKADSSFIYGVVCSKNVTHKKMRTAIKNPTIMLLKCAFEFQRNEDELSTLDTLQLQEYEYLKNVVAKITKFQPSIILVQKSVSRIALDMLYELGVVVAVNVKPVVMNKVARSTNATLLHSLDQLSFDVRLGTCGQFYIHSYSLPDGCKKTLMYFDRCDPAFGCVITLRGGELRELKKVKRVARFALHMAYNSFLESSFLADGFALLPEAELKSIQASAAGYHSIPNTPEWSLYSIDHTAQLPLEVSLSEQKNLTSGFDSKCTSLLKCEGQEETSITNAIAAEQDSSESMPHPEGNLKHLSDIPLTPTQGFSAALKSCILTISPNIRFTVPYLLTETMVHADVHQYLSKDTYWSKAFKPARKQVDAAENENPTNTSGVEQKCLPAKSKPSVATHAPHNYKSMSEHAFTTSIFMTRASSNDMKAALADYRARAGHFGEDSAYFFQSAKRSCEYQRCINKVFRKYRHFEMIANEEGLSTNAVSEKPFPMVGALSEEKMFKNLQLDKESVKNMNGGEGRKEEEEEDESGEEEREENKVGEAEKRDEEIIIGQLVLDDVEVAKDKDRLEEDDKGKLMSAGSQAPSDVKAKAPHKQPVTDCMDPNFHQSISVVYSTLCTVPQKNEDYCVRPHVICMQYYGKSDLTLGDFLQRFCFRFHYFCNVCNEDMLNHCHRIVHNLCAIDIHLYSVPNKTRTVSMWFKCTKCDKVTSSIEMNEKSLLLSFAKFLELKFYGSGYTASCFEGNEDNICPHSALMYYTQYFCCNGLLAEFCPTSISVLNVRLPSQCLVSAMTRKDMYDNLLPEVKNLQERIAKLMEQVTKYLEPYQHVPAVAEYREKLKAQKEYYYGQVKKLKEEVKENYMQKDAIPDQTPERMLSVMDELSDVIVKLKIELIKIQEDWNNRMEQLYNDNRKHFWESRQPNEPETRPLSDPTLPTTPTESSATKYDELAGVPPISLDPSSSPVHNVGSLGMGSPELQVAKDNDSATFAEEFEAPQVLDSSAGDYAEIDGDTSHAQGDNWLVLHDVSTDGEQNIEPQTIKERPKKPPRKLKMFLSRQFQPLQSLFRPSEHHSHVSGLRVPLSVYEDEPASVIAFALSSHQYTDAVSTARASTDSQQQTQGSQHTEEEGPTVPFSDDTRAEHISLEFHERNARFYCKVYFAKDFEKLREQVIPSGEDRYIRQLSRSVGHRPRGGKTGAEFYKTVDNRLLVKEVQPVEMSSFEEIAPKYFQYISSAVNKERPLLLAKILGIYTVGFKNTKTGNSKRLDVVVMENLLCGCKYQKIFDLKGCTRNRCVEDTSSVLLDVNFLKYSTSTPVYLFPHSKRVLMQAMYMDTQFLAENSVIDYSLLTCVDRVSGELVVGIIDFLRTFTLDKRLEMHVKKLSSKTLPTVVYPELYRKRFFEATERYFTAVPDKWTGLESDPSI